MTVRKTALYFLAGAIATVIAVFLSSWASVISVYCGYQVYNRGEPIYGVLVASIGGIVFVLGLSP
jgi:hypothetical protein